MRLVIVAMVAVLTAGCEQCECVTGPTPVTPPGQTCTIAVLTLGAPVGRAVTGTWTPPSAATVTIEEEQGGPGQYGPPTPGFSVQSAPGSLLFTAAKDGRYRITLTAACGSTSRIVLIDTAPPPEPPPPPFNPPGPPPCVVTEGLRPHPGC